jgi:hypothetical protein
LANCWPKTSPPGLGYDRSQQHEILGELKYRDAPAPKLAEMFHSIRKAGNDAVHQGKGVVRLRKKAPKTME